MSSLGGLYNELIIEHNKKPRNYAELAEATNRAEGFNPLCGDHIWLYLELADNTVKAIGFQGKSCAICQASASIMTTLVKGRPVAEAEGLVADFRGLIVGSQTNSHFGDKVDRYMAAFAGIANLPSRVKCAILPWHTLHAALNEQSVATTEGDADPVPGSGGET